METPALNPTGGVTGKKPPPLGGLSYEQDPSRPGGGVFIAHGPVKDAYTDVGPGTIISSGSEGEGDNDGSECFIIFLLLAIYLVAVQLLPPNFLC